MYQITPRRKASADWGFWTLDKPFLLPSKRKNSRVSEDRTWHRNWSLSWCYLPIAGWLKFKCWRVISNKTQYLATMLYQEFGTLASQMYWTLPAQLLPFWGFSPARCWFFCNLASTDRRNSDYARGTAKHCIPSCCIFMIVLVFAYYNSGIADSLHKHICLYVYMCI